MEKQSGVNQELSLFDTRKVHTHQTKAFVCISDSKKPFKTAADQKTKMRETTYASRVIRSASEKFLGSKLDASDVVQIDENS